MLAQHLSQKQLQKLSPQQIQLMKLLQVPTAQLEQRIKEELEINPALEDGRSNDEQSLEPTSVEEQLKSDEQQKEESIEEKSSDDIEMEEYLSDDELDIPDYKTQGDDYSDDDDKRTTPTPIVKSFHDFLEQQLGMLNLDDHQFQVADQIIGSIDDDGYLRLRKR